MTYAYGNTITKTHADGYTRAWRGYFNYTVEDKVDTYKITVTTCGVEGMHTGSMSFGAGTLTQTLKIDNATKKTYNNSSKISISGINVKKELISADYSITVTKTNTTQTKNITLTTKVSSDSTWSGTSTKSLNVTIPALATPVVSVTELDITGGYDYLNYEKLYPDSRYGYNKGEGRNPAYLQGEEYFYSSRYDHWNVDLVYDEELAKSYKEADGKEWVDDYDPEYNFAYKMSVEKLMPSTSYEFDINYEINAPKLQTTALGLTRNRIIVKTYETAGTSYGSYAHQFEAYMSRVGGSKYKILDFISYEINVTVTVKNTATSETVATYSKSFSHTAEFSGLFGMTATFSRGDRKIPTVMSDGKFEAEVKAYNYITSAFDIVSSRVRITTLSSDLTEFNIPLTLDSKYVADPSAESPTTRIKFSYITSDSEASADHDAFYNTTRQTAYSNGTSNVMFIGGTDSVLYNSRVWYSYVNDPLYFPDDNFIEVGSNDTSIMGLTKIGEYLGIIKQGKTTDTSIYIAYPTTFNDNTTYAVKPSVNGVGACAKFAFNILGSETLFLSKEGVMAITFNETDVDKQVRNRSYYIDGKLLEEPIEALENAYSFVYNGFYLLAVDNQKDNGHVYLLDGNQRNSWGNDKTNLVYECYYWTNVPAKCFAEFKNELWFSDGKRLCRFKTDADEKPYNDNGEAIKSEWSTPLDDDSVPHYFKNLVKKGTLVTLLPCKHGTSCKIYIKVDNNEEYLVTEVDTTRSDVAIDCYLNRKIKKYKRLQFIMKNDVLDQNFGIGNINKLYTLGNYSKRGAGDVT